MTLVCEGPGWQSMPSPESRPGGQMKWRFSSTESRLVRPGTGQRWPSGRARIGSASANSTFNYVVMIDAPSPSLGPFRVPGQRAGPSLSNPGRTRDSDINLKLESG